MICINFPIKMAASAAEEGAELESKQKKGEKFLNKAARTVCYNARDGFWDCMTVGDRQGCHMFHSVVQIYRARLTDCVNAACKARQKW